MPEGAARSIAAIDLPVFRPRAPWFGGDLQTLRTTVRAAAGVGRVDLSADAPEHFHLAMSDGSGDALAATLSRPRRPSGKPLAVLIHGLTGCEDSAYMRATAAHLLAGGYPVLRRRGHQQRNHPQPHGRTGRTWRASPGRKGRRRHRPPP